MEVKEVVDPVMGAEKPLCLSGRLEALHLSFSSPGGLIHHLERSGFVVMKKPPLKAHFAL